MKRTKGFATLTSVLIIGALGTTLAVSLLLMGLASSQTSFAFIQSHQSKALADACMEEALERIRESTPFTGTGTLTLGAGSCAYTVTSGGSQNRTATSSGTVGSMLRKVKVTIDKITPLINVTSWQEVADF